MKFLYILVILSINLSAQTFIPDFKVNEDAGFNNQFAPDIVIMSNGNTFIVWRDDRNGDADIFGQFYASDGTPIGSNFRINDDPGSASQGEPAVHSREDFTIVAWEDRRTFVEDYDIYAQIFINGVKSGNNFRVNDDNSGLAQRFPAVTVFNNDAAFIIWQDQRDDFGDIYGQVVKSDGTLSGANIKINEDVGTTVQSQPAISSSGTVVINLSGLPFVRFNTTWRSNHLGSDDIFAQNFDYELGADITVKIGINYKVNDVSTGQRLWPSVAMGENGNYVFTWSDRREGPINIYAQAYENNGTPIGTNFKVNDNTNNSIQQRSDISAYSDNKYNIVWEDTRNGQSFETEIFGQNFLLLGGNFIPDGSNFKIDFLHDDMVARVPKSSGSSPPLSSRLDFAWERRGNTSDIQAQIGSGDNFKVNDDFGSSNQFSPDIAVASERNFAIVWADERDGNSAIYGRTFSFTGEPNGNYFNLSGSHDSKFHHVPKIEINDFGETWGGAAWRELDQSTSSFSIHARFFSETGVLLGDDIKIDDNTGFALLDNPGIAVFNNARWILGWFDGSSASDKKIQGQILSASGNKIGNNFIVDDNNIQAFRGSVTSGDQPLFVFSSRGPDNRWSLMGRAINSDGTQGNGFTFYTEPDPDIELYGSADTDADGNIFVAFARIDGFKTDIYVAKFDANGNPLTNARVVNDLTGFRRREAPNVAVNKETGKVAVTWTLDFEGTRSNWLQRYFNDLSPFGENVFMNHSQRDEFDIVTLFLDAAEILYNVLTGNRNVQRSDGQSGTGYDIWANAVDFNNPVNVRDDFNNSITGFYLYQNYPNPFNPATTIQFSLPQAGNVTLKIFNLLGEEVKSLVNEYQQAGNHSLQFKANNLASGIYFYRLQAGSFVETKKLVLIK